MSRLHVIPYSSKTEQELAKAASRNRNGGRQIGRFEDEGGNDNSRRQRDNNLTMREIPRENLLPPKEGEEPIDKKTALKIK